MELSIQKSALVEGMQIVQNAVSQKSSLPILSNVLLEAELGRLKLTATDLDIGICSTIAVTTQQEGSITVPAKKFFDIIRALPEDCDIDLSMKKNNSINIKSGKANFKILGLSKEEFPQLPLFKDKDSVTVPQSLLREMFTLTDFAISKDDTRYVLNGILLEVKGDELTLVSTDGKRMALMKKKLPKKTLLDKEVVVPTKTVQEVKRLLTEEGDAKIQFSDTQIMFLFPEFFIISRLIEGEFPNYKKVIPDKSKKQVKVAREELLSATKRASIFTDQDSLAVKLDIQKKKLTITKNTPYLGEAKEQLEADYTGEEGLEIGFNPKYLMDVLKNMPDEEIVFEVSEANKPGVIRKGEEYVYVVLPMQLTA
ncbi:MAG: DNA polymerase III subunit beta, partial [Candidatus Omnitrophota bacterium]